MYFSRVLISIVFSLYFGVSNAQSDLFVPKKTVEIGLSHFPPLIIIKENSEPEGMLVNFVKEVAIREDWKIQWVVGNWHEIYEKTKKSEIDILTYIAYTDERTQYFNFSQKSFVTSWGQVYTHDNKEYQNILDFDNKTIGVLRDDVHENGIIELCDKFKINCKIKYVDSYEIAFKMLENKELEGAVIDSVIALSYETTYKIFRTSIMYKPLDALFATPVGNKSNYLQAFDKYLIKWEKDPDSPYSISKRKWLGSGYKKKVPDWIYYLFIMVFGLLILSSFVVSLLRKKIKKHVRKYVNQSNQLDQIIDLVPHMIYVVNSEGRVVLLNKYASNYFGVSKVLNTTTYEILEKVPMYQKLFEGDEDLLEDGSASILKEITCYSSSQQEITFNISKVPFATNNNSPSVLTVGVDITEELAYKNKIQQLAHHDELTGLPNRTLLKKTILRQLELDSKNECQGVIVFIDLDFFKNVNDSLGHSAGDELLKCVSTRVQKVIGKDGMLARIGGDEFIVFLQAQSKTIIEIESCTTQIVEKILDSLSTKFTVKGNLVYISASIGIVICPRDANNYERGMQRVDIAMYHAKAEGRNCYAFFKSNMEKKIFQKQATIRDLHIALEKSEFFLDYQPQINSVTNEIIGLEALIRWKLDSNKIIPPNEFIPNAEECGLIVPIGNWVLEKVFHQLSVWLENHQKVPFVSINLSVLQFHNSNFINNLQYLLRKHGVPPYLIEFEVTESVMIENIDKTIYTVSQLKNLGFRLSIDDFGTGYSSLSYLKKLPFDKLKIDYSFIKDITSDIDTKTIVRTIIGMSKELGLEVVAEGVETKKQITLLKKMGCNQFQGFYYDKPNTPSYIEEKYFKIN